MKKFIIIFALVFVLSGCGVKVEKESDPAPVSMFVELESGSLWKVVYHKQTKVMYAVSNGTYSSGWFTLLVNPDGSPMLYEGGLTE